MPPISAPKATPKAAPVKPLQVPAPELQLAPEEPREIIYPDVTINVCQQDNGTALTADQAKELLGWQELDDKDKGDYLFTDYTGKKIRCNNNHHNRPFRDSWARTMGQEILNRRFVLNGETGIIGKTGQVLSMQHRLAGLVLAKQRWESTAEAEHWATKWETEPVLDCIIVFGIDESSEVTRTLDNVMPRTLADVLFCGGMFGKVSKAVQMKLTRITDFAVRLLWHRMGLKADAYSPHRTHSESLELLDKHPKIVECVQHIHRENVEDRVKRYVPPGTAAGLMYLMAATGDDGVAYRASEYPSDKDVDWKMWDTAQDFWTMLACGDLTFDPVRKALGRLTDPESLVPGGIDERIGTIVAAWNVFVNSVAFTEKNLKLEYFKTEDGDWKMVGCPKVGGLDLGNPQPTKKLKTKDTPSPGDVAPGSGGEVEGEQQVEEDPANPSDEELEAEGTDLTPAGEDGYEDGPRTDPTPAEIAAQAAKIKAEALAAKAAEVPKPRGKGKAAAQPTPAKPPIMADVVAANTAAVHARNKGSTVGLPKPPASPPAPQPIPTKPNGKGKAGGKPALRGGVN